MILSLKLIFSDTVIMQNFTTLGYFTSELLKAFLRVDTF